jgi:hypothetical protein
MSPHRPSPLAYYAAGGSVMSRSGREVTPSAALLAFYQQAAVEQRLLGDEAGAAFCVRMALELAKACVLAADWRRAATGVGKPATAGAPSPHTRSEPAPGW